MFRVLLTGAKGQLGSLLLEYLREAGCEVKGGDVGELDITDLESVMRNQDWSPDIIVNAAAYTAVDNAESEEELAYAVNALGVKNLLVLSQELKSPLINVSTDYVFDGQASSPYRVEEKTSPLGVYGRTKRAGEEFLEASDHSFINIRTSWVFGENGNNFVKTMLRLGKDRDSLSIVADQRGCPTYAGDLAKAILVIVHRYRNDGFFANGHYHFCGNEEVSWFEFAETIFEVANAAGVLKRRPTLTPIPTSEYPTPAARPAYSVLDCSKISGVYDIEPSDWNNALNKIIPEILI
ncbi:MAG: dTDP-4-dehydrorhamnose reductase [Neptuniibacter sp.]